MEAELVRELPHGDWQYEPKWDGFRGVLENDGGELALWSRNERPLLRYFPELRPLGDLLPPHSALDGEIVIERGGRLDFDAMQMRLHPAESRIRQAVGRDPGPVRRLRRPALEGQAGARPAVGEASARAGEAGEVLPDLPGDTRSRGGRGLARRTRGRGTRRSDRKAARPPLPTWLTRRRGQGQGAHRRPTAWSSASAGRRSRPGSRRSCSASTARTASSTTSGRPRWPRAGTTTS